MVRALDVGVRRRRGHALTAVLAPGLTRNTATTSSRRPSSADVVEGATGVARPLTPDDNRCCGGLLADDDAAAH